MSKAILLFALCAFAAAAGQGVPRAEAFADESRHEGKVAVDGRERFRLSQAESDPREQKAWEEVQRLNTIEGYIKYLETYPAGRFAEQAREHQRALEGTESGGQQRRLRRPSDFVIEDKKPSAPNERSGGSPVSPGQPSFAWNYEPTTGQLVVRNNGREISCKIENPSSVKGLGVYRDNDEVRVNFEREEAQGRRARDQSVSELCRQPPPPPVTAQPSAPTCPSGQTLVGSICVPTRGEAPKQSPFPPVVAAPAPPPLPPPPPPPPQRYIALAISRTSHMVGGWSRSQPTLAEAEQDALGACRGNRTRQEAAACRIVHSISGSCIGLSWTRTGNGWGTAVRATKEEAEVEAMSRCRSYKHNKTCILVGSRC